jgi:predicted RNA-binding protein with RPS1 domain
MIVDGIVKNITEYGCFVDLGGIGGLLHITDMNWGRVNHPSAMFEVGVDIKVKVLNFRAAAMDAESSKCGALAPIPIATLGLETRVISAS